MSRAQFSLARARGLILVLAAACSGDAPTDSGGGPTTPPAAFSLSSADSALAVAQRDTASTLLQLSRTNYLGGIYLSVTGLPSEMTVSIAADSLTPQRDTATVHFVAGTFTPEGSFPVRITASGRGLGPSVITVTVTVSRSGGFTLSSILPSPSFAQEAGVRVPLVVSRDGSFTLPVSLEVLNVPSGMSATLLPARVSGDSTQLWLTAAGTVAPGSYTLRVAGAGGDWPPDTLSLPVTIAAEGPATTIEFDFCHASASWVGYANRHGRWTNATLVGGTRHSARFTTPTGSVALAQVDEFGRAHSFVWSGSMADLQAEAARRAAICAAAGADRNLSGIAAGVADGQRAAMSFGPGLSLMTGPDSTYGFIMSGVEGAHNLVAARRGATAAEARVIIRRDLNPANGATLDRLDFNDAEAIPAAAGVLTISGRLNGQRSITAGVASGTLSNAFLVSRSFSTDTVTYLGLPLGAQAAEDSNAVLISEGFGIDEVTLVARFKGVGNRNIQLGPLPATASRRSLSACPVFLEDVFIPRQATYGDSLRVLYWGATNLLEMRVYDGYREGAPDWDLSIPWLSTAAGYDPGWAFRAANNYDLQVISYGPAVIENDMRVQQQARYNIFDGPVNGTLGCP